MIIKKRTKKEVNYWEGRRRGEKKRYDEELNTKK